MAVEEHPRGMNLACPFGHRRKAGLARPDRPKPLPRGEGQERRPDNPRSSPRGAIRANQAPTHSHGSPFRSPSTSPGRDGFILVGIVAIATMATPAGISLAAGSTRA